MKESDLSKKQALLIRQRGGWARKIAGGPTQAGLPDVIGCYRGRFLGIETKMPGKERTLTELQKKTLSSMGSAGGIAVVATTVGQVRAVLDAIDAGEYD